MIVIKDINSSYRKVFCDTLEEAKALYDGFSLKIPGIEFSNAYKMGAMDGKHHFINAKGEFLFGLKDKVIDFCKTNNLEYIDETKEVESDIDKNEFIAFVDKLDLPFEVYDHQIEGAYTILKKQRAITLMATGSGKSCVAYIIARYCISKNLKFILICPSVDLIHQMNDDFKDYFSTKEKKLKEQKPLDEIEEAKIASKLKTIYKNRKELNCEDITAHISTIYGGQEKYSDKLIRISTYQSLSLNSDKINPTYFQDIDVLLVDECIHPNSLITMSDGSKKMIKDVKINDEVLSINENTKQIEKDKVVKVHKNLSQEKVYELMLEDETILYITGNHKIQTYNRGWVRVDELMLEDEIITL